jgi:hypothetical protein
VGAHIEWIRTDVGILRVGREFEVFYDPYEFACTVDKVGDTVTFKGAVGDCAGFLIVRHRQAIRAYLPDDVRHVTRERVINGEHKWIVID